VFLERAELGIKTGPIGINKPARSATKRRFNMLKRMLTVAMLTTALMSSFAVSTFAQDQNDKMMKSENKMGEPMMKNDDKMMKSHKSKHKSRKAHKKATTKSNNM